VAIKGGELRDIALMGVLGGDGFRQMIIEYWLLTIVNFQYQHSIDNYQCSILLTTTPVIQHSIPSEAVATKNV
jgi:hypothetical protein